MATHEMPKREDIVKTIGVDLAPAKKEEPVDEKRVGKVTSGKVVKKKASLGRRFLNAFFGEEVEDVRGYILQDILIPTIKETINEIICGGTGIILFGNAKGNRGNKKPGTYFSYNSIYDNKKQRPNDRRDSNRYSIDDIILESRGEAEEVLSNLLDLIQDYGAARVADLNDMVGVTGQFTDNYWGWTDLSGASVKRVREGYLLVLPKAVNLK